MRLRIEAPQKAIEAFCRKWKITELALFGSVLRDDFRPDSDVDVLIAFAEDSHWSLYDILDIQDELKTMLGHEIHITEKPAMRNPFRRYEILRTAQVIYAA
jgi:predicted nucleotidyltransferase